MSQNEPRKLGRQEGLPDQPDTAEKTFVLPADDPPAGEWVDTDEVLANPTDEEVAEGVRLGQAIDTDDDEDNGIGSPDETASTEGGDES